MRDLHDASAPGQLLDQRVGRGTVIQEAVNNKLSDFYRDAITEAERVPMLQPEVDVVELPNATGENGGQLAFTAEVTVRPVIELPDLSKAKLKVEQQLSEVSSDLSSWSAA